MRILTTVTALQAEGLTVEGIVETNLKGRVTYRGSQEAVYASECRQFGILESQIEELQQSEEVAAEFTEEPSVSATYSVTVKTLGAGITEENVELTAGLLRGYLERGTLCDSEGTSVRSLGDVDRVTEENGRRILIFSARKDGNQ